MVVVVVVVMAAAEKENVRVLYLMFAFRAASTSKIKCASQIEMGDVRRLMAWFGYIYSLGLNLVVKSSNNIQVIEK